MKENSVSCLELASLLWLMKDPRKAARSVQSFVQTLECWQMTLLAELGVLWEAGMKEAEQRVGRYWVGSSTNQFSK